MAVRFDLVRAGTQQVREPRAEFAALAHLPADAHLSLMVFLDGEVALEVAVEAHYHAFEAGSGTLMVCLRTEGLFARGADHCCCGIGVFLAVGDAATEVGVDGCRGRGVFSVLKVWADMDILVENQVVEVCSLAHVDGDFGDVELLGCEALLEVRHENGPIKTYFDQPVQW